MGDESGAVVPVNEGVSVAQSSGGRGGKVCGGNIL